MTPDPTPPERAADDQDIGWGDDPREDSDDAEEAHEAWLRAQRPPHHGD